MGWNPAFEKAMDDADRAESRMNSGGWGGGGRGDSVSIRGSGFSFSLGNLGGIFGKRDDHRRDHSHPSRRGEQTPDGVIVERIKVNGRTYDLSDENEDFVIESKGDKRDTPEAGQTQSKNPSAKQPASAPAQTQAQPKTQQIPSETPKPESKTDIDPKALQSQLASLPKAQVLAIQANLNNFGFGASTNPEKYSKLDTVAGPKTTQGFIDYAASRGLDPKDINGVMTAISKEARGENIGAAHKTEATAVKETPMVPAQPQKHASAQGR